VFGLDRSRQSGRSLEWKVGIFTVGATLALAGMYLDERWMTGLAIAVLLVGIAFRLVAERSPLMVDEDDEGEDEAGEDERSEADSDG
jgi:cadmium resistance protein CadD (predicted permease)